VSNNAKKEGVMLPAKQKKAFFDFQNSISEHEFLDKKTTVLIRLAASMALGCIA
jgi:hypothetical protein